MEATSSTVVPTTPCKRKAEASWGFTTGQDVLNLAMNKHLQTTDSSKPEDMNGFVYYLEHVRKVVIVDVQPGSLIITVECGSLQILEELWQDYCTGYVNKMAEKFLLTKDVLNELGLSKVRFSTSIPKEKYRACHGQLRTFDSGECLYFDKYVASLPSIGDKQLLCKNFIPHPLPLEDFFQVKSRARNSLFKVECVCVCVGGGGGIFCCRSLYLDTLCNLNVCNRVRTKMYCFTPPPPPPPHHFSNDTSLRAYFSQ